MLQKVRSALVSVTFLFAFFIASFFGFQTAHATDYPVLGYLAATNMQCPPGTWVHTWVQSGHNVYQCTECTKGNWKAGTQTRDDATRNQTCAQAGKGYYVDTVGASEQTPCPDGSAALAKGQTSVTKCLCKKGYFSAAGYGPCTIASSGNYVSGTGQKAQTPCPAGTYATGEGSKSCTSATAGNFVAESGSSAQTPCPAGTYSKGVKSKACTPCPAGTYASGEGNQSCTSATAGNFVAESGLAAQTPCPAGTYSKSAKSTACTPADAGYYVSSTGATVQIKFPAGTYAAGTKTASCTSCSPGTSTVTGSTSQESCLYNSPADYYSSWGGKAAPGTKGGNPQKCKSGKNWKTSQQACK